MVITRRLLTCLSRALLVLMLFTQFAHAAQPCMMAEKAPAMAFDEQSCHDNANVCLADCTDENQSAGHVELAVLALSQLVVLTLPEAPGQAAQVISADSPAVFNSDPPIPIRFCSFLT